MALPKPVLHILMTNKTALKQALSYHALSGAVFSSQLSNELLVPSLAGPKLRVNIYQFGKVSLEESRCKRFDFELFFQRNFFEM